MVGNIFRGTLFAISCAAALVWTACGWAQTAAPSAEDITRALTPNPAPLTRSFRGVEVQRPQAPPTIDLYVNFRFDSAELDLNSVTTLNALGNALKSPQLKGAYIEILGHTDGIGSAEYNQKLSEQRADAVKQYLVRTQGIPEDRLRASGRGKSQLKHPQDPNSAINRRVEVRNVTPLSN